MLNISSAASKLDDFKNKSKTNERILYYSCFSIIFASVALIVFNWLYRNGKSFVWQPDGFYGHFQVSTYLGIYYRAIIRDFFNTGVLSVPLISLLSAFIMRYL
jgi:hypothetical protein